MLQSCKHESWTKIAKYLVEDVPTLLSSKDVKDVKDVLSIVFNSLPSKFLEFIKWVAEVRRLEDGDQSLSSEEKQRLAIKVIYNLNRDVTKFGKRFNFFSGQNEYFWFGSCVGCLNHLLSIIYINPL